MHVGFVRVFTSDSLLDAQPCSSFPVAVHSPVAGMRTALCTTPAVSTGWM